MINETHKRKEMLRVENLSVQRGDKKVLQNISFTLSDQEQLVILGAGGSGKTSLGLALANKLYFTGIVHYANQAVKKIVFVDQQHSFKNKVNTSDLYYQQRYNSFDSEETISVQEYLQDYPQASNKIKEWGIEDLLTKPLIQLSNGENKKLQIAKALASDPTVLILDQPFIGLDMDARSKLHKILDQLRLQGILIVLITSLSELPNYPFELVYLESGIKKEYTLDQIKTLSKGKAITDKSLPLYLIQNQEQFQVAIRMKNVNITYGENQILQHVNWEIFKGERWLLKGHNGAGKSTLLSLITGDNPQAYSNEIYLFDRKRGSGESIWDIKNRIGYMSPELHLFYEKDTKVFNTIGSGFFDSIGLFRKLDDVQKSIVQTWIDYFQLNDLSQKFLYQLSLGQQRLVLLIRAFVKNPSMLILDEPCQGLDAENKEKILEIIDQVCTMGNKTLVYVSHYLQESPLCIEKTLVLKSGQVLSVE